MHESKFAKRFHHIWSELCCGPLILIEPKRTDGRMKSSLTATAEADAGNRWRATAAARRVEKRDIAIDFFSGLRLPTSRFFSYLVLHSFIKVLKTVACFIHFY